MRHSSTQPFFHSISNAKILLFFLSLLIYLSCSNSQNEINEAQATIQAETRGGEENLLDYIGTGCHFSEQDCPAAIITVPSIPVTIPSYPGCTFYLTYRYQICAQLPGLMDVAIYDFQIVDYDCPQFAADLAAAVSANTAEIFINTVEPQLYSALESQHMINYVDGTKFKCNNQGVFNIDFITPTCKRYCLKPSLRTRDGYVYVKINCNSGACCQRHSIWCWDGTQWVLKSPPTYVSLEPWQTYCQTGGQPSPEMPPYCVHIIGESCTFKCPEF